MAMLDEQQLRKTSLQIGWLLLEKAEGTGQEAVREALVTIVDHLNAGSALIDDPAEAVKAAQLNLMASSQARAEAAFEAASGYLSAGMQLLPADCWQNHYTLALELFTAGAEVALLKGDLARAEALALEAEAMAHTLLEKARIVKILMDIYVIQNQLDQVIELGIAAIKMFGFDLEDREPPAAIGEQVVQLPEMTEPRALAISRLMDGLLSAAFARMDGRFVQLILFSIELFSRFGNPPGLVSSTLPIQWC
jgi:predicted ATPase